MHIIERGTGEPLVVIPGIQGRWEYARPTVEALAASFRVITFSLADEPSAGFRFDAARGFDSYSDQVRAALDEARIDRATICGISFGGLVALRFAATHPERTSALVLASTPGPSWHLKKRHAVYARLPWLAGPLFLAEAPWRLRAETAAAFPVRATRRRFVRSQLATLLKTRLSLRRMAARALMISPPGGAANAAPGGVGGGVVGGAHVSCPTLVITGESTLDHVVPGDSTSEYLRLIPGARGVVLERTGHLGSITKPDLFARVIRDFANGRHYAAA